jgi:hypothetical protein
MALVKGNTMKVQDVVVHKGFSERENLHYGAWGVVTAIKGNVACVRFSRMHGTVPKHAGEVLLGALQITLGAHVDVPLEHARAKGEMPGDNGPVQVWDWYGEPVQPETIDDVISAWLEALRSGRYRQTMHCLRDSNGFSVMGVACDIIGKRYRIGWRHMEQVCGILGNYTTVPKAFLKLLLLTREEAEFIEKLNDSGYSFDEVTAWISSRKPKFRQAA